MDRMDPNPSTPLLSVEMVTCSRMRHMDVLRTYRLGRNLHAAGTTARRAMSAGQTVGRAELGKSRRERELETLRCSPEPELAGRSVVR